MCRDFATKQANSVRIRDLYACMGKIMQFEKLVSIENLSEHPWVGLPVRTLRSLWHAGKIPGIRLGYRTVVFDPAKVRAALDKFEVKTAGSRRRESAQ